MSYSILETNTETVWGVYPAIYNAADYPGGSIAAAGDVYTYRSNTFDADTTNTFLGGAEFSEFPTYSSADLPTASNQFATVAYVQSQGAVQLQPGTTIPAEWGTWNTMSNVDSVMTADGTVGVPIGPIQSTVNNIGSYTFPSTGVYFLNAYAVAQGYGTDPNVAVIIGLSFQSNLFDDGVTTTQGSTTYYEALGTLAPVASGFLLGETTPYRLPFMNWQIGGMNSMNSFALPYIYNHTTDSPDTIFMNVQNLSNNSKSLACFMQVVKLAEAST